MSEEDEDRDAQGEEEESDYSEDFENTSLDDYNLEYEGSVNFEDNDENDDFDNDNFKEKENGDEGDDLNDNGDEDKNQNNYNKIITASGSHPQTESFPESGGGGSGGGGSEGGGGGHSKYKTGENRSPHYRLDTNSLLKLKDQLDEFDLPELSSSIIRDTSPVPGIDSKIWKSQLTQYDQLLQKCIANENKRSAESSFITSTIAKTSRHSRAIVEKQLQIALNQINSYRKENEFITKKLDTSIIHQEFERQKQTIHEQELKIRQLVDENRALQAVRRGHEKQLLVVEREKELQPEKDKSLHRDHRFLEKKLKSLKNQVVNLQVRDRVQFHENRHLKQKNLKLTVRMQALEMTDSVAISLKKQQCSNSLVGGIGEDGMSMEVPSIHMIGDESKGESWGGQKDSEHELDRLFSENARLKSIVSNQRTSFKQQLTTLQSRLEKSLQRRKDLEVELERREKEMKVQLLAVKELNKTCEELMKTNTKLRDASSLYSRVPRASSQGPSQIMNHVPKPPMSSRPASPTTPSRTRRAVILSSEDDLAPGGGNITFITSEQDME